MQSEILESKAVTIVYMLKKCCSISQGQIIHTVIVDETVHLDNSIKTALVAMYVKLGSCEDAQSVFQESPFQNKRSLAVIMSGYTNQGHGEKALQLFEKYYKESDAVLCICALKACFSTGAHMQGKLIHFYILEKGFDLDQIVGNSLITLYASCSSLSDAHQVFISLPGRDVVSWCTMILGCIDHGYCRKALQLFERMQEEGVAPNRVTFLCVLRACGSLATIDQGRSMHANLAKLGLDLDVFIGSTLIDMYSKCKCLQDSRNIFDSLHDKNVVSWSTMISGYFEDGQIEEAFSLFKRMTEGGLEPDKVTYVCLVKVCASDLLYEKGILIHIELVKKGFDLDSLVGNSLVYMYTKFGSIENANKIFDVMPVQDMIAWSLIIVGQIEYGDSQKASMLLEKMVQKGIKPDTAVFAEILKTCSHVLGLTQGMLVHTEIVKRGLESNMLVRINLVDVYASCGCINDARCTFDSIPTRSVVLWNSMISRCADFGFNEEAFKLFHKMQEEGIPGNRVTALCILKACSISEDVELGRLMHTIITANGIQSEPFVENALIDMYAQCGSVQDARKVFDILPTRDVVSWSSIISAHAESLDGLEAFELFKLMQKEGVQPNERTFVCVLNSSSTERDINQSMLIHHHVVHGGFESNVHIGSTLAEVYARCGSIDEACQVFDMLPARNVVAWSSMLSVCIKHGYDKEVSHVFEMMHMEGIEPNAVAYILALSAFANMGTIDSGRMFHIELAKRGFDSDMFAGNTMVDMYTRCGSLYDALCIFDKLSIRTSVSWNTLISGLADHGLYDMAEHYLNKMQEEGAKADGITFLSLLTACSHEGLVQEGCALLKEMEKLGVTPSIEHYVCLIDMLGRGGFLYEAEITITEMLVQPNWLIWMTLLGSCAKYNNVDMGKRAFDILIKSRCRKDAIYVLMSNIYAANQMWQAAKEVRERCL